MPPVPPHPARYVHGETGPVAVVPGRVAAWLALRVDLDRLRVDHRGDDPEVDAVLVALTVAAKAWRTTRGLPGSEHGTSRATRPEPEAQSPVMTTSDAADRLGIGTRAVVKAIDEGRLPATRTGSRWTLNPDDVEHYRETRTAC